MRAASPPVSTLTLAPATPNPKGAFEQLFIVRGDITRPGITLKGDAMLPARTTAPASRLTVFHINDLHHHLVDFSDQGDIHRAAQIAKQVERARAARKPGEAILFVSAGDDHIGTIFDELLGYHPAEFRKSAAYRVESAMGLDIAVVGNHEFDKGSRILDAAITQDAAFPVLCSNIVGSAYDLPCSQAAIGIVGGLRLGFIGLTNPDDIFLHTKEDPALDALDPLATLDRLVPLIAPLVDGIILLDHVGYDAPPPGGGLARHPVTNGDRAIARRVSELTGKPALIVGGHSHTVLNQNGLEPVNLINNIAVVQAGAYGRWLGKVVIEPGKDGRWTTRARLIATRDNRTPQTRERPEDYDTELQRQVIDPLSAQVLKVYRSVIGRAGDTPEISDARTTIDRYTGEAALANFVTDAIVARSVAFPGGAVDFAGLNSTALRGIPPGAALTYKDIYQAMPYADTIYIYDLTGRQLRDIIDNNAKRLFRLAELRPGGGTLDPAAYLERGFIQFSAGVRYDIVLGPGPGENRVENLTLSGQPIAAVLERHYRVALPSYIAHGRASWNGKPIGGGLAPELTGYDLKSLARTRGHDTGLAFRAVLLDHIRQNGGFIGRRTGARKDGRLRVRPAP